MLIPEEIARNGEAFGPHTVNKTIQFIYHVHSKFHVHLKYTPHSRKEEESLAVVIAIKS